MSEYVTRSVESALEREIKLAISHLAKLHACSHEEAAKKLLSRMRREREDAVLIRVEDAK